MTRPFASPLPGELAAPPPAPEWREVGLAGPPPRPMAVAAEAVKPRTPPPHRYVYVIGPAVGLQKIGLATDPRSRLARSNGRAL